LAPGFAVGARRGAVVEDAPVAGPRPAPLRGDPVLLAAGLPPRRLVDAAGTHTYVDPASGGGGAVGLELRVFLQRLAAHQVAAVDLRKHGLGVRLAVLELGIVPGQRLDRAIALELRFGVERAQPLPQLVRELKL